MGTKRVIRIRPGDVFGYWTVLGPGKIVDLYKKDGTHRGFRYYWRCRCSCGVEQDVSESTLLYKINPSCCTCARVRAAATMAAKTSASGFSHTRMYKIWRGMVARCCDERDVHYSDYGGRGITVCEEWKNDFFSFRNWALENGYASDLSIDRIRNNQGYTPDNCRWATPKQQANNRSSNHILKFGDEEHTLTEWAEIIGISPRTLRSRLRRGWSVEDTITLDGSHKDHKKNKELNDYGKRVL